MKFFMTIALSTLTSIAIAQPYGSPTAAQPSSTFGTATQVPAPGTADLPDQTLSGPTFLNTGTTDANTQFGKTNLDPVTGQPLGTLNPSPNLVPESPSTFDNSLINTNPDGSTRQAQEAEMNTFPSQGQVLGQ